MVAGPSSVALGLAAHLVSGGAAPPAAVLVAITASVSLLAAAASRIALPAWALGLGAGAVQQVLHLLFTALAGPNAPLFRVTGHVHGGAGLPPALGPSTVPALDLHLAVVVHVAAALLSALLTLAALRAADRGPHPRPHPVRRVHGGRLLSREHPG